MALAFHHSGVLSAMENSYFEFHLTGSRFFGNESRSSDWDFFVESQEGLSAWLSDNGFTRESESHYASTDVTEVWSHVSGEVHVQVVSDAALKIAVQDALRDSGHAYWLYSMAKDQRKVVWNLAFSLFNSGKKQVEPLRREPRW